MTPRTFGEYVGLLLLLPLLLAQRGAERDQAGLVRGVEEGVGPAAVGDEEDGGPVRRGGGGHVVGGWMKSGMYSDGVEIKRLDRRSSTVLPSTVHGT